MKHYRFFLPLSFFITFQLLVSCAGSSQHQSKNNLRLERVVFHVEDDQIRNVLEKSVQETAFSLGQALDNKVFKQERNRILAVVQENVDPNFEKDWVTFNVDTTFRAERFSVEVVVRRNNQKGEHH